MEISSRLKVRKLQALKLITSTTHDAMDIANQLKTDNVLTSSDLERVAGAFDRSEILFILLEKAASEDRAYLVNYEWTVLPIQQVKLTVVGPNGIKEFSYEGL